MELCLTMEIKVMGFCKLQKAFDIVDHQIIGGRNESLAKGFVEFQLIDLNPIFLIVISIYP